MSILTRLRDWLGRGERDAQCTCDQSMPLPNDVILPPCRVHAANRDA